MEATHLNLNDLSNAVWRKSSRSGPNGGDCVEVASNLHGIIAIRDSKNPTGTTLTFTPNQWRTFLNSIKHGLT